MVVFAHYNFNFYLLSAKFQDEKTSESPDSVYKRKRKFCSYLEEVCC